MQGRIAVVLISMPLVLLTACGRQSAADREARLRAGQADSLAMAEQLYDPSVFDTVIWADFDTRVRRGQMVWRASCEKCHGREGAGDGDLTRQLNLSVPSFLTPDWKYAYEADSLRHRIFVGLEGAMPNWGLHGLKYRDIDAAVAYVNKLVSESK